MIKNPYAFQTLSQINTEQGQSTPFIYTVQPEESNEGGLNLGELWAVIRRRIIFIIMGTTTFACAGVGLALNSPPIYVAKFEILTEPITAEDKVVRDDRFKADDNKIDETKLKILQSPKLMSPLTQEVQKYYPGSTAPQLNIKLLPNTKIVEVSYQDPNPKKVLFVLNQASESYLKYSLEERQTETKLGIKFVEKQLPQLLNRMETLQSQLQLFRQKYGLINAEVQGQELASQFNQIVQKRLNAEMQLARTKTLYTILQKQLRLETDEAEAISILSESPDYQKLLSQLQDREATIAIKSSEYTENSPNIQTLLIQKQNLLDLVGREKRRLLGIKLSNTKMNSLDLVTPNSARLREIQKFLEINKQIEVLKTEIQSLNQAENSLRQQIKLFPFIIRQKDDLERQLKIAVDNLNHFLTELERLRIDSAQKQIPWQILTPPIQPENLAPSTIQNLIVGTVLGLLLSTGFALIIDKLNNVFYDNEEVKDKIKFPILGNIPHIKFGKNGQPDQKQNISKFWESFRSVYTNIALLKGDSSLRSLAVISAAPGDGKSTIAFYLAQTAAVMGKRVLLVDANLRNPSIHKILDLPNTKGLSNLIAEGLNFENVIHRHSSGTREQNYGSQKATANDIEKLFLEDNLFILTTGEISQNPTSLLSSPQMESLTEQFKQSFDLIIYDTSHLLGFADTNILSRHTDASILVIGVGKTNRSVLAKALEQLNFSSTPILGAITVDV
ncbi:MULTISPECIES: tyrosine-protein kinase domain-containing protein [Nostocales]|uniref:Polysaccharide biosynthesis tyrosine autokinase n=1 Tax=Dolichospermum flos-aquae UHCC 0037 TaxID=2590026 RepID=A0ACC7S841_DOLFA|nr:MULTISPECIES: tyrosine-protein kinase domain-containing protein [Nostocales]MBO1066291.1 polysaccharide biosynthesis tyrosine autokinase [Anabaena sp. 54]MTJ44733.1 polysaccharide biosynthesis tyrosine autokinase [Dolichospermum flos-aquae UHCC 0037]